MKLRVYSFGLLATIMAILIGFGCEKELNDPNAPGGGTGGGNLSDTLFFTVEGIKFSNGIVSNVSYNTAKITGQFASLANNSNPVVDHGHVWAPAPNSNPEIGDPGAGFSPLGERTLTGQFSSQLQFLSSGTLYYARAYIKVGSQYIYHNAVTAFSTLSESVPSLQISPATGVSQNSLNISGLVISDGGSSIVEHGFVYSRDNITPTVEVHDGKIAYPSPIQTNTTFSTVINGLNHTTFYNIRAYARNSTGVGYSQTYRIRTNSPYVVDNGLKAYFTFESNVDNAAGLTDYNATGFGITYSPDTPNGFGASGQFNPANQSYANIFRNPLYQAQQGTIALWLKSNGGSNYAILHGNHFSNSVGFGIIAWSDGSVSFNGLKPNYTNNFDLNFPGNWGSIFMDGNWHHLAITVGINEAILYIDGNTVIASGSNGGIRHSGYNNGMLIGRYTSVEYNGDRNFFYNGLMDNLRIYDRVLTAGEIQQIFTVKQ